MRPGETLPSDETRARDTFVPASSSIQVEFDIPGYALVREVRRGGQGVVFEAIQQSTGRSVAVKVLLRGALAGAEALKRFDREVRVLAQLSHPHIVTIHDRGEAGGRAYFVMDFVPGGPITQHAHRANLSIEARAGLLAQVCDALSAAHHRGVVHRDLKPGNILVDADGRPRVLDFGLAKVQRAASDAAATADPHSTTGEFQGTLPWASPEQIDDFSRVDARSDVYSLGVVAYELLAGRLPHPPTGSEYQLIRAIREDDPPSLHSLRRDIPVDLDTIVRKCLHKQPERRYADAGELADDLRRFLTGQPIAARRDSLGYVVGKRVARVASRQSLAALAVVVVASALLGPVLFTLWPRPLRAIDLPFESAALSAARAARGPVWSPEVTVVALDDASAARAAELAAGDGLVGVSAQDPFSMRLLHAALLRRLVELRPRAVVVDIHFEANRPEYDAHLGQAVDALAAIGCPVAFAVMRADDRGRPVLCHELARREVAWGWSFLAPAGEGDIVRGAALAVAKPGVPPSLGLGLAALAAARRPDARPEVIWNTGWTRLEVRFPGRAGSDGATDQPPEVLGVALTGIYRPGDQSAAQPTAAVDERSVLFTAICLPDAAVLREATLPCQALFANDLSPVRPRIEDRVVFVGDARLTHPFKPDRACLAVGVGGRQEFNVYAHAGAASDLLLGVTLWRPGFWPELLRQGLAAALGALLGWRLSGRWWRVGLAAIGCLALALAAGVLLAVAFRLSISISATALALVAALVLTAGLRGLVTSRGVSPQAIGASPSG